MHLVLSCLGAAGRVRRGRQLSLGSIKQIIVITGLEFIAPTHKGKICMYGRQGDSFAVMISSTYAE